MEQRRNIQLGDGLYALGLDAQEEKELLDDIRYERAARPIRERISIAKAWIKAEPHRARVHRALLVEAERELLRVDVEFGKLE